MHLSLLYIHIYYAFDAWFKQKISILHEPALNPVFSQKPLYPIYSSSETHSIKPRFTQQLPVPCARPRRAQRTAPIANLFGHDRQTRSASSLPLFPWAFEPPSWQPDVSFSFHVWTSWAPLVPAFAAQRPPKIDSPHRHCVAPAACARNPSQTRKVVVASKQTSS